MADLVADAHAKDKIPLALVSLHRQGGPILATSQLNRRMIDGEQEQCSQRRMGGCGLWRMEDSDKLVKVLWEVQVAEAVSLGRLIRFWREESR